MAVNILNFGRIISIATAALAKDCPIRIFVVDHDHGMQHLQVMILRLVSLPTDITQYQSGSSVNTS